VVPVDVERPEVIFLMCVVVGMVAVVVVVL
jgi:hypothetical protein